MASPAREATAPSRVRRKVLLFTLALGVLLYLDRAALSVLAPAIRRDLGISALQMGWIFSAFVWGYAIFHLPAGWLGDRVGARRVLSAIVVAWSSFTAATALAWSFGSMLAIRFLFGAAEAGATPNVSQSYARWIPASERARAQAVYFTGMSTGAAAAPMLVTALLLWQGWRMAFLLLGAAGVLWAVAWSLWYRDDPRRHPSVNAAELSLIGPPPSPHAESVSWRNVLRSGNVWAILLMYFTYGYTGYIYITWFPSYLQEERHLSVALAGVLAALPNVLGMVAKPIGGWWSDRAAARKGVVFGRRIVGVLGFGVGAAAVLPGLYVADPYLSVFFLALADGGAALAHAACFAVCLDIGAKRAGTVSALMLTMGSLGNAASALCFGWFLQAFGSYTVPFLIGMGANLAGALLWFRIDPRKQLV